MTMAILSHLHQDHIGGIAELPNAEIVVSAIDWSNIDNPGALIKGVMADHVRLPGVRYRPVDIPPSMERRWKPRSRRSPTPSTCAATAACCCCRLPALTRIDVAARACRGSVAPAARGRPDLRRQPARGRARARSRREEGAARVDPFGDRIAAAASRPLLAAHDPAAAGLLAAAVESAAAR